MEQQYKVETLKEMSWLPEQHEEQLQLGFRIIQNAFKNKVHAMEQEVRALRHANEEKTQNITGLQKKNSALEVELIEAHQRAQQLAEENKELLKTVNGLNKHIKRLEDLKAKVMSSIQDEQTMENEDGTTAKLYTTDGYLAGAAPISMGMMQTGGPMGMSQTGASMGMSQTGGATMGMPAGSPANAPLGMESPAGAGGSPSTIDGKQFFRQARSRLSYESFNAFLANIKRLNNHQQSREETLDEARRIFGNEHADLYGDFQALLNRHT